MDAVLGLSVTPAAVSVVLVDGPSDGGLPAGGEGFEVRTGDSAGPGRASSRTAAAVRRAEAMVAGRGRRVQSIGVTWSEGADAEAGSLLEALSDSGLDNVVKVRMPEATEALARGIAQVTGYQTTAVCVVEPGALIALVVNDASGAVQTAVNHSAVTEEDLIGWLGAVFARTDWAPESLVLVGSAEDLDGLAPVLQNALSMPVLAPAEAPLALARGAAVACAHAAEPRWSTPHLAQTAPLSPSRARRMRQTAPAAMLAAGMVTFVASASAALALQFTPGEQRPGPAAGSTVQTPAAFTRPVPAPQQQVPAAVAEPAAEFVAPEPEPAAPQPEPVDAAPIVEAAAPLLETEPVGLPALDPPAAVEAPPAPAEPPLAPPPAEVLPPPVPEEEPGLMQRIRDRLAGIGDDEPAPIPVAPVPPPVPPLPAP
ncbi:MAG: hypothetical protein SW019_15540 [Actinomycetota bacterium]|nr:hypothetical protein [Actinomycetota bacterium]